MGTNFYLFTKNKNLKNKYFKNAVVTDEPDFGYRIHIAKTSAGWLPLFEAYNGEKSSVKELLTILKENNCIIEDEYGKTYSVSAFVERVVKFNGGFKGAIPLKEYKQDKNSPFYDKDMPDFLPVSHFDYGNESMQVVFFKDEEGYEFMEREFS